MENVKEAGSRGGTVERLTERNESGGITVRNVAAALEKLAELEDAEQDGRSLIKAAKEIAEFCDGVKDCDDCPFFEKANNSCALDDAPPSAWDVWGSAEAEAALKEPAG